MTIDELFIACNNITLQDRFFIITSAQDVIVWGDTYLEIPHQVCSMKLEHFKCQGGDVLVWME